MTQFIRDKVGNSEAQQKSALAYLLAQDSTGLATDGVLTGLAVSQTTTASASVNVASGACVTQDSVGNGASVMVNDTLQALDVLGANPMGGTPRNDLVVFDSATLSSGLNGLRVIPGIPNAVPSDPTVPATAVALARIRNLASATTVPAAQIDDLRSYTSLADWGTWVTLSPASGVAGTLKYRKRGNSVDVQIDVTGSFPAGFFTAASAAGAVPVTARPAQTPARAVAYVGSGTAMGSVEVTTAGTINVQVAAGTAGLAKVAFTYGAG